MAVEELMNKYSKGYCVMEQNNYQPSIGYLPPANEGNIFTSVCQEFRSHGGAWSWGSAWSGGECLVPGVGGTWSQGGGVPGLGGAWFRGGCGEPPGTATAAGGTNPTGMHSCKL